MAKMAANGSNGNNGMKKACGVSSTAYLGFNNGGEYQRNNDHQWPMA